MLLSKYIQYFRGRQEHPHLRFFFKHGRSCCFSYAYYFLSTTCCVDTTGETSRHQEDIPHVPGCCQRQARPARDTAHEVRMHAVYAHAPAHCPNKQRSSSCDDRCEMWSSIWYFEHLQQQSVYTKISRLVASPNCTIGDVRKNSVFLERPHGRYCSSRFMMVRSEA